MLQRSTRQAYDRLQPPIIEIVKQESTTSFGHPRFYSWSAVRLAGLGPNWAKETTISNDIDNELLYTGRRLDPETGLQLNRNRFYGSHIGRWLTQDPIGYEGGLNLYEYVGARPTYYEDPFGLEHWIGIGPEIFGFHKRICVDTYNKKCEKTGRYCVTFYKDGAGGYCGGPPDKTGNGGKGPGIPGITENETGDGIVGPDPGPEPGGGRKGRSCKSKCDQDRKIKDYLDSLTDQRGNFNTVGGNCRTFSESTFDEINRRIESGDFGGGGGGAGGGGGSGGCCK